MKSTRTKRPTLIRAAEISVMIAVWVVVKWLMGYYWIANRGRNVSRSAIQSEASPQQLGTGPSV